MVVLVSELVEVVAVLVSELVEVVAVLVSELVEVVAVLVSELVDVVAVLVSELVDVVAVLPTTIVSPEPVSQTLQFGSVAIPLTIVVPLPSVNTPFEYLTSIPCQPATLPDGDGFV